MDAAREGGPRERVQGRSGGVDDDGVEVCQVGMKRRQRPERDFGPLRGGDPVRGRVCRVQTDVHQAAS